MKLSAGLNAPDFTAPDQNGMTHTLAQYKGKWVLLYFYPKDFTSGCTTEACKFRDNFGKLKDRVEILGVSNDSVESHKKYSDHYTLPFTLLADPEKIMTKTYGTDGILFTRRTSFLINPQGVIVKIYEKVNPQIHAEEVLTDLAVFQK